MSSKWWLANWEANYEPRERTKWGVFSVEFELRTMKTFLDRSAGRLMTPKVRRKTISRRRRFGGLR